MLLIDSPRTVIQIITLGFVSSIINYPLGILQSTVWGKFLYFVSGRKKPKSKNNCNLETQSLIILCHSIYSGCWNTSKHKQGNYLKTDKSKHTLNDVFLMQMCRGPSMSHQRRQQTAAAKQTKFNASNRWLHVILCQAKTQGNQRRLIFAKQPVCESACGGVQKEREQEREHKQKFCSSVFI